MNPFGYDPAPRLPGSESERIGAILKAPLADANQIGLQILRGNIVKTAPPAIFVTSMQAPLNDSSRHRTGIADANASTGHEDAIDFGLCPWGANTANYVQGKEVMNGGWVDGMKKHYKHARNRPSHLLLYKLWRCSFVGRSWPRCWHIPSRIREIPGCSDKVHIVRDKQLRCDDAIGVLEDRKPL